MTSTSPVGDPIFLALDGDEALPGPAAGAPGRGPGDGQDAVTGGGMVALVDPTRGLRSLWRGRVQVAGPLGLRMANRLLHPAPGTRLDDAGWERELTLLGGARLRERAVLLDSAPALILHWTCPDTARTSESLVVDLRPPAGRPALSLELTFDGEKGAWAVVLPPGSDPERSLLRVRPAAARARSRRARNTEAEGLVISAPSRLVAGSAETNILASAVRLLDRAPLGFSVAATPGASASASAEGTPVGPFVVGVDEGAPRFAGGAALAELGLGALMAGRFEMGWAVLAHLLASPPSADDEALAVLHLAGAAGAWTGALDHLLSVRSEVDLLVDRVVRVVRAGRDDAGEPGPPAALPGPGQVLEALADAVEPAGRGWRDRILSHRQDLLREGSAPAGVGGGRKGLPLPVLGTHAPTWNDDLRDAVVPPVEAFGPLEAPGLAPRRALHAARLVRSWVEGTLGARPDAAYGRLRLAPDLVAAGGGLAVRGLRVGDARFSLACRIEPGSCTFQVVQEGGRVPVNVVFEPRVPLRPPVAVRLGDEAVQVDIEPGDGGILLRCQFPLDPERRLVVRERGPNP